MLIRLIKRYLVFDKPEIFDRKVEGHKPIRVDKGIGERLLKLGYFTEVPEAPRTGRPKVSEEKPKVSKSKVKTEAKKESAKVEKEKKDE